MRKTTTYYDIKVYSKEVLLGLSCHLLLGYDQTSTNI